MGTAKCNLVELFHGLPVLEDLYLCNFSHKYLAGAEVPTRLSTTLVCLKGLLLYDTMLDELDELSFILCLVRSSPNLKHIEILFRTDNVSSTNAVLEFLKVQDYSDVMLNELKEVKLTNVTGTRPQLEVIEILLSKSPSLEKMQIQNRLGQTSGKGFKLLKELMKFQCASKKAEVIYADVNGRQVCSLRYMKLYKIMALKMYRKLWHLDLHVLALGTYMFAYVPCFLGFWEIWKDA